jgi:6-pyruvoyl-tetrahydropterin synthase
VRYGNQPSMFKAGDHVRIDASNEIGTVKEVHPHQIVVRVQVPGGHEERKYALEDLRLDPTLKEVSEFYDH